MIDDLDGDSTFPDLHPLSLVDRASVQIADLLAEVNRVLILARQHKANVLDAVVYLRLIDQLQADLRMAGLTVGLLSPWLERETVAMASPEVDFLIANPEQFPTDQEDIRRFLATLPESDRQDLFRAMQAVKPGAVAVWQEISSVTSYRPGSEAFRWPRIEEGVKFLEQRRIVTTQQWETLAERERVRTVYMPGSSDAAVRNLRDSLAQSFRDGESLYDFRKRLDDETKARQWEVETIYRTATKQAYLDGVTTLVDSPVGAKFPFVKYVATTDNRTRPEHAKWDGKIVATGSPEYVEAKRLQAEYNCRCTLIPLTERQAKRIQAS